MPLEIGLTEFTLEVPALPESELRDYTLRLFDAWDGDLGESLPLPDYSIHLEVEEGSLKGRGRVAAAAIGIVTYISAAGGFIAAAKEITWAVKKAGSLLVREAGAPYSDSQPKIRAKRTAARIGDIERLIARVQSGQLDRREAAVLAQALLEIEGTEPGLDDLKEAVLESVASVQRTPTQLVLPSDEFEELLLTGPSRRLPSAPRPPRPKPVVPPPERFRAEVWRESKKGRRQVQVTPL